MATTLFINANIVTPTGVSAGQVLVDGRTIAAVSFRGQGDVATGSVDKIVDVAGDFLAPGFIDIHTHGGGGADFMDGSVEAVYSACRAHLLHGTTSIIPTTITSTKESLLDFVELFNRIDLEHSDCPTILGLHLEGPYFAPAQSGAQDPKYMRNPSPEEYERVLELSDRIVRWSFAIELEGALPFLRKLREKGIISSLAHSDATCEETVNAYENGVAALTHFYSGMAGVRRINAYRVAGAIEAGYLVDDLFVEVIADGKHLPAELLKLIYKIKGADRICLVSDSMRAAGMPDGAYKLGHYETGVDVIVEEGVAKMPDRTAFAGSVATADRLVRTMYKLGGAPLHEAVKMMSLTPAKLMGIAGSRGSICVGKNADLVVFDNDIAVRAVMARGELTEIP